MSDQKQEKVVTIYSSETRNPYSDSMSDAQQNEPICNEAVEAAAQIVHGFGTRTEWQVARLIQSAITKALQRAEISVSEPTSNEAANCVVETWDRNSGRVFEAMGSDNPRVQAIDEAIEKLRATMARDDVDRRDSSGARDATPVSQNPLVEDKEGEKEQQR